MLLGMVNIVIIIGAAWLFKDIHVYLGLAILGILFIVATVIANKYLYDKQYVLAEKIL